MLSVFYVFSVLLRLLLYVTFVVINRLLQNYDLYIAVGIQNVKRIILF